MNNRLWKFIFIIVVLGVVVGCSGPKEFTVKDRREVPGTKSIDTIKVDNRNGTTTQTGDRAVAKNFRREPEVKLNSNSGLDESKVKQKIRDAYNIKKTDETKACSIFVDVPAGMYYEYDMEWTEVKREGDILEGTSGDGNVLGTYTITVDYSCQTVEQRTIGGTQATPTP